jgi:uroporphyrinogen-III decarboxylase
MVGLWIASPFDWWSALRGGPQTAIMDTFDRSGLLSLLFRAYTDYAVAVLQRALATAPVDSVGIGGSTTSMSVISPGLHRAYSLPFGRALCAECRRAGVPTQYHMCGRSRQALPVTAEMGVDGFDALECPPTGDVDLAEVKRTFGERFSLKGNVNSITVMLNGGPDDVVREVERCMEAAKAGGGYICSVGDQCPPETPDENIFALVEAARRLGAYG